MDLSAKIRELYSIVQELETAYPGRHFTPDGHMIGSIGEVIAADAYHLKLLPNSTELHDAVSADGKLVQIKATQRNRVSLSGCPQHLIVLFINRDGSWDEVYNGPGQPAWELVGKLQKNGQRTVSITALRKMMSMISNERRIPNKFIK